jgi:hypothetical protein
VITDGPSSVRCDGAGSDELAPLCRVCVRRGGDTGAGSRVAVGDMVARVTSFFGLLWRSSRATAPVVATLQLLLVGAALASGALPFGAISGLRAADGLANSRTATVIEETDKSVFRLADAGQALQCAERLSLFIAELDDRIVKSENLRPLLQLIQQYFPLRGCQIDQVIEISRRSAYYDRFERHPDVTVFIFRHRIPNGWGFNVSFGILNASGDSELPAAIIDKTQ